MYREPFNIIADFLRRKPQTKGAVFKTDEKKTLKRQLKGEKHVSSSRKQPKKR